MHPAPLSVKCHNWVWLATCWSGAEYPMLLDCGSSTSNIASSCSETRSPGLHNGLGLVILCVGAGVVSGMVVYHSTACSTTITAGNETEFLPHESPKWHSALDGPCDHQYSPLYNSEV